MCMIKLVDFQTVLLIPVLKQCSKSDAVDPYYSITVANRFSSGRLYFTTISFHYNIEEVSDS